MRQSKIKRASVILHALSYARKETERKKHTVTFTEYHKTIAKITNREDKVKLIFLKNL